MDNLDLTWCDATGGITCPHGVTVHEIASVETGDDFRPCLPNDCVACQLDALSRPTLEFTGELQAFETNAVAPSRGDQADNITPFLLPEALLALDENALPFTDPSLVSDIVPYDPFSTTNAELHDAPDGGLARRMQNLNVADHQVHAIASAATPTPAPAQPPIKGWKEESLEEHFEKLSTKDKGFNRSEALKSDYCPHGFLIYREVLVDRFSPYDHQLYHPLAEQCPECCFDFVCKELYELRQSFLQRRTKEDALTRNNVGSTMHRVRLQWQYIWAIRWKENKWREEWGNSNPEGETTVFEDELHQATEGGTIELPRRFDPRAGRWPQYIMC